ncbi:MAG TPA: chromosomal replication initiator protein DnaA, partial [Armatimonadota bacterium]|nr:chromosomal replication initiator protein DnaA [Armatimonadota bacterium]
LWNNVMAALRLMPNMRAQEEWLQGSRIISFDGDELTIEIPRQFSREFIEKRCRRSIEDIIDRLVGERVRVCFSAVAPAEPAESPAPPVQPAPASSKRPVPSGGNVGMPLNRRYQFESFVTGECNQFAYAASLAVANSPGNAYNPLFLCGGVGIGKTHLLQAIGHEIARLHPSLHVAYVTSEAFTYEFVSALRERHTDTFRKRYRTVDVWLVDDVQFIAQKESTEEEFFLTFTALQEAGRQIVLGSDRYPKDMHLLDDRLCSRFESGLIADLRNPDADTRLNILRHKAEAESATVSDDVLLFVAHLVQANVRTLEGALVKLLAYASLTRKPLTESLAREVLEDYYGKHAAPSLTVESIQRAICDFYHIDVKALKSKRRDKHIVLPRQVAMYLARELTNAPLTDIGYRFGGRDHSTVIAACNKIRTNLADDGTLQAAIEELSCRLRGQE